MSRSRSRGPEDGPKKEIKICRLPSFRRKLDRVDRLEPGFGWPGPDLVKGEPGDVWLHAVHARRKRNLAETARHQGGFAVVPKLTEQSNEDRGEPGATVPRGSLPRFFFFFSSPSVAAAVQADWQTGQNGRECSVV